MIEALVITLREGIEAALIVGITLAYLAKTGRSHLNRQVYAGLLLAVLGSIAFAGLFQALAIDPENEYLEGAMLGVGGIFVASVVIWMWRTARSRFARMEESLGRIVAGPQGWTSGLGLLLFTFFMVFREGVEMVLFLMAAALRRFELLSLFGDILGLALAVLFAYFFIRGSLRINLPRFFGITSIVLLLLAAKLLAGSLHEFAEVGLIPMTKEAMAFLGYFVRENTSIFLLMILLLLPMVMILWDVGAKSVRSLSAEEGSFDESPVQRRMRLAAVHRERVWRASLLGVTLLILLAMGSTVLASSRFIDPVPTRLEAQGPEVVVPLSSLGEGQLHKFSFSSSGVDVRFLVVKLRGGGLAVGLDACQICGPVGYMQEGENAICKNCNAPIPMHTMGEGGGCNPLPLAARVEGDSMKVLAADLAAARLRFER